jgi:gas vesicle protein
LFWFCIRLFLQPESKGRLGVNKFLKMLLKSSVYLIDEYAAKMDRASDRVSGLIDRSKEIIQPEDHRLRNALSFAAGVGVGLGAAILFAPASGEATRNSITQQLQEIRARAL